MGEGGRGKGRSTPVKRVITEILVKTHSALSGGFRASFPLACFANLKATQLLKG
jgi:hypothetical protein